jgi:hypothetical protein
MRRSFGPYRTAARVVSGSALDMSDAAGGRDGEGFDVDKQGCGNSPQSAQRWMQWMVSRRGGGAVGYEGRRWGEAAHSPSRAVRVGVRCHCPGAVLDVDGATQRTASMIGRQHGCYRGGVPPCRFPRRKTRAWHAHWLDWLPWAGSGVDVWLAQLVERRSHSYVTSTQWRQSEDREFEPHTGQFCWFFCPSVPGLLGLVGWFDFASTRNCRPRGRLSSSPSDGIHAWEMP